MANIVASKANIEIANRIKQAGFRTALDAQPEMRERFVQLRTEGYTIKGIRKKLLEEFPAPEWHVPSRPALERFVKNRLQQQAVIEPYTPDYNKLLRKLDPIKELARTVMEAKKQYEKAVKAKMSVNTQSKLLMAYQKLLVEYQNMLDRKGISRCANADNVALHQHLHLHQENATNGLNLSRDSQNMPQNSHILSRDGQKPSPDSQNTLQNSHNSSQTVTTAQELFNAFSRLKQQADNIAAQNATPEKGENVSE